MFIKHVYAFAVLILIVPWVAATPLKERSTLELVSIIELEEPCVRQGGICLRTEDCDPGNLVRISGVILCPAQRHLGVECCYN